jgi:hypothetical protein
MSEKYLVEDNKTFHKEDKLIDQSLKMFEQNNNMDKWLMLMEVLVDSSRLVAPAKNTILIITYRRDKEIYH